MNVRALTEADLAEVARVINEATPDAPVDEEELLVWLTNPARDVVFGLFERDRALVAYADLGIPAGAPDRAWLDLRIPPRHSDAETVDAVLT